MRHNHGLRAQSGSIWTPSLIASSLWLDASDAASITTIGGAVSQWNDKSGNGRHLAQGTSSLRPLYSSTGFNGRPAIDFDGVDDWLRNDAYQPYGAYTAFFVVARDGASEDTLWLIGGSNKTEIIFINSAGYTQISLGIGSSTAVGVTPSTSTDSRSFLLWSSWDGAGTASTDCRIGYDGTPQYVTTSGALGYDAEVGFGLGRRPIQGTNTFDGKVSEVLFFDHALADSTIATIEGYLAHKWGLASSLPTHHPYKSAAPRTGSQNIGNVSLLLSGDGTNGAQNNTFVDSSGNGRSVTRGGNITQGSFSPYGPKSGSSYDPALHGGSAYFDGSGDFVTLGGLTSTYLSGDFTIEGWVWLDDQTSQMFFNTIPHPSFGISLNRDGSGQTSLYIGNGTSWLTLDFRSSGRIPLYAWTHVAVVRSSNAITIYHNGIAQGTTTANMPGGFGQTAYLGTYNGATGENSKGYVSDYRITRSAVYTSNFTPPTAPISAIANTEVLLRFTNGGVTDATGNNVLETVDNAQVSTTQKKFGTGALYFDGNGDYLQVPASNLFAFGTANFTVEFWYYHLSGTDRGLFANNSGASVGVNFLVGASGPFRIYNGTAGNNLQDFSASPSANTWQHLAVVRSSGIVTLYVNGVASGTANWSGINAGNNATFSIGAAFGNARFANGYIDDLRITKGVARYTANFTPPSSAFPLS